TPITSMPPASKPRTTQASIINADATTDLSRESPGVKRRPPAACALRSSGLELGGGAFALRSSHDASEHLGGVAVQDLLARVLADLGVGERLPGPVAAELGAVSAADDAVGTVEPHGCFDRARTERVAVHVHPGLPEAR